MENSNKKECPCLVEGTFTCSLKVSTKSKSVGGSWDYSGGVPGDSGDTVYVAFYGPCNDTCPIDYIVDVVRKKI